MFIPNVNAKTYYSKYKEDKLLEQEPVKNEYLKYNKIKLYKYYKEDKVYLDYQKSKDETCPNIDLNDYKYTDWSKEKPKKDYIEKKEYHYQKVKVRYLFLIDFNTDEGKINLSSLKVYNKENIIPLKIMECSLCSPNISDILNVNMSYINNKGKLVIDLGNYYDLSDLKVYMNLKGSSKKLKELSLFFTREYDLNAYIAKYFMQAYYNDNYERIFYINDFDFNERNAVYEDDFISENKINNKFYKEKVITWYKEKLYRCYKVNKTFTDYQNDKNDLYPTKSDDYKIYYQTYTRDYIDIYDNIVIRDDETISDYIKSNIPYHIKGDINYQINGIYKIKIINDFKEIIKEIKVNKISNYQKEINMIMQANLHKMKELEKEIMDLNNTNRHLNNSLSIEKIKNKELLDKYEVELEKKHNNSLYHIKKDDINKGSIFLGKGLCLTIFMIVLSISITTYMYLKK